MVALSGVRSASQTSGEVKQQIDKKPSPGNWGAAGGTLPPVATPTQATGQSKGAAKPGADVAAVYGQLKLADNIPQKIKDQFAFTPRHEGEAVNVGKTLYVYSAGHLWQTPRKDNSVWIGQLGPDGKGPVTRMEGGVPLQHQLKEKNGDDAGGERKTLAELVEEKARNI